MRGQQLAFRDFKFMRHCKDIITKDEARANIDEVYLIHGSSAS
jgi:hypothetical protein